MRSRVGHILNECWLQRPYHEFCIKRELVIRPLIWSLGAYTFFFKLHKKVSLFSRYKFMRATWAGGEIAQLLEHLLFLQRTRAQFPTLRRLRMAPDSSSGESNALFWHRRSLEACVNTCTQTHMLINKIKTNLQNVSNRFSCWTLMPPVSNWYQEEWEITHKYLKKIKVLYQNQRVQ